MAASRLESEAGVHSTEARRIARTVEEGASP
jgi:hypothetical protein